MRTKDEINEYHKKYEQTEKRKKYVKNYTLENKEKIRATKKLYFKKYYQKNKKRLDRNKKIYIENNKGKVSKFHIKYQKNRERIDINYKLTRILRSRLRSAIKNNYKSGSAVSDLDCTISYLKKYLEEKFIKGMTWDNYGEWHIDHIIPLSSIDLTNREELLKVVNYKNLQPLWAKDNFIKSNKI